MDFKAEFNNKTSNPNRDLDTIINSLINKYKLSENDEYQLKMVTSRFFDKTFIYSNLSRNYISKKIILFSENKFSNNSYLIITPYLLIKTKVNGVIMNIPFAEFKKLLLIKQNIIF